MIASGAETLLEYLKHPITEVIPKGWKTTAELAKETGRSTPTISRLLNKGLEDGTIQRRMFRVDGRLVPHYLIK